MELMLIWALICFLSIKIITTVDRILPLHGRFVIYLFNQSDCSKLKEEEPKIGKIQPGKNPCINFENKELQVVQWDYYSNSFKYILTDDETTCEDNTEEAEKEKNNSLLCNGSCLKVPFQNSSIYYTCIFNNIIEGAKIKIVSYSGVKQCEEANIIDNETYSGNELCWTTNYGDILPVYWDDDRKRLFYSLADKDCLGSNINISSTYLTCNGGCFKDVLNEKLSYSCNFFNQGTRITFSYLFQLIFILLLPLIIN